MNRLISVSVFYLISAISAFSQSFADYELSLSSLDLNYVQGTDRGNIVLSMRNLHPVIAVNWDLTLPEHATLDETQVAFTGDRTTISRHTIAINKLPDGNTWRFVVYSSQNKEINGESGELITVPVIINAETPVGQFPVALTAANLIFSDNGELDETIPVCVNGTLANGKAGQTIVWGYLEPKMYGDEDFTLPATTDKGLAITYVSSDELVATVSGNVVHVVGVGVTEITASQAGDENYFSAIPVTLSLTVAKAVLTVTADNKSREYGEENPLLTYSFAGFKNNEESGVIDVLPVVSTIADRHSDAGNYDIVAGNAGDNNYDFAYTNGNLEITKATVNITVDNQTREYGEENPTFTYSFAGFKNNEESGVIDVLPVVSTIADRRSDAGNYDIVAENAGDNNYDFAYTHGELQITKALLTITADDKQRKFGEANPEFTISFSGFKNDEDAAVLDILPEVSCAANESSPAGFYDIVLSGGSDNNYDYYLENGILEVITQAGVAETRLIASLQVYPNPVKDYLYIRSDSPIDRVEIYSQLGACILVEYNFTGKINLSALPVGLYLAQIYTEGVPVTKKIRVEN
jgi:hypothetical protein